LRLAGYRGSDLGRVYALNLLLIPVNLAGVFRSLQQVITGRKAAFGRTPKVESRTAIPPLHVLAQGLFLVYLGQATVFDFLQGHYSHALFALGNCAIYGYGISCFLGWRASWADLLRHVPGPTPANPEQPDFVPIEPPLLAPGPANARLEYGTKPR